MATIHHDSGNRIGGGRAKAKDPSRELVAADTRKAASVLKREQSPPQTTLASQTTLSPQPSTSKLSPKSLRGWSNLSAEDSSHAPLWPSVKMVCAGHHQRFPPEADKDSKSVVSDATSSTKADRSPWLSVQNASERSSSPSPHGSGYGKMESPLTTWHYKSLWPSLEKINSFASSVTSEMVSGGLTPTDTQSLSASGASSTHGSFWPKGKVLLEDSDSERRKSGGNRSEMSMQSSGVLSEADFLSEQSSAC